MGFCAGRWLTQHAPFTGPLHTPGETPGEPNRIANLPSIKNAFPTTSPTNPKPDQIASHTVARVLLRPVRSDGVLLRIASPPGPHGRPQRLICLHHNVILHLRTQPYHYEWHLHVGIMEDLL